MPKSQIISLISVGNFGNSVNSVGALVSIGFIVRGTSVVLGSEDKGGGRHGGSLLRRIGSGGSPEMCQYHLMLLELLPRELPT
jgi:hypothetical protein